jgi:hypothetical protein
MNAEPEAKGSVCLLPPSEAFVGRTKEIRKTTKAITQVLEKYEMTMLRNPRHERFAELFASGIRPAAAYVSLGYSKNGAPQSAAKLLQRPDVRRRVDEILACAAQSVAAEVAFDQKRCSVASMYWAAKPKSSNKSPLP